MKPDNFQPEENESDDWRTISIAWIPSEPFAPRLMRRPVRARSLLWNGGDAKWVSPFLSADDGGASSTVSLNFTADVQ